MTIKPDIIVTWPRNCDYPLWRQFIHDERARFGRVIVVFMETNSGDDYRDFLRHELLVEDILTIDSPAPIAGEDWRNVAVCEGLKHSESEWVWFTEQDFYVTNPQFWKDVEKAITLYKAEAVGVLQGSRIHPCSLFVTRQVINRSHCNFGIVPEKSDHFGIFTDDLQNMQVPIAIVTDELYKHYNGLSHNWRLASDNIDPNYKLDEFLDWLLQSLNCTMTRNKRFEQVAETTLQRLLPHYSRTIQNPNKDPKTTPPPSK